MLHRVDSLFPSPYARRAIIIAYDALCILLAYYLAYVLRFESFSITEFDSPFFIQNCLFNFFLQLSTVAIMGIHRGLWRFSSTSDLTLIIKAVIIAITISFVGTFLLNRLEGTPRSVYLIDSLLLIISLSGGRFAYRIFKQKSNTKHSKNAILVGAGFAGEQLIREFKRNSHNMEYNISCILDDDPKKINSTVHGIKIRGIIDELPKFCEKYQAQLIFIAIPSASNNTIRHIYSLAKKTAIKVHTLPPITDLLSGKISFKQMREVQVEDLVGRNTVDLHINNMAHTHRDKIILITGAGGSIGSELCRQVLKYHPRKLIMVDNSEFNIYKIIEEFTPYENSTKLEFFTDSVYDQELMDTIFDQHSPNIVYHAAAYKHVPIMEQNPLSAIKTNILGTYIISRLAVKHHVDKFILISTDKAVNPTNIMGTTKRIAEMICEKQNMEKKTTFSMVRFGNVLGSSGSVIPKFKKQIAQGGPVTVTHPEVTRFFMTIPEASQLVIQAGCLAKGGEIFVLDMGTPIKIADLAKELINLAGYEVDTEIEIKYTGLKPGEKLYEEVLSDSESTRPTTHTMVRVAQTRPLPEQFDKLFKEIINLPPKISKNETRRLLKELVTEYSPQYDSQILDLSGEN